MDDIGLDCHFRFAEMYGVKSVQPDFSDSPPHSYINEAVFRVREKDMNTPESNYDLFSVSVFSLINPLCCSILQLPFCIGKLK